MASLAFVFVIVVFNCMLCVRCQLRDSNNGVTLKPENNVERSIISGNISTHKQLGDVSPYVHVFNKSIIDDYALLQTIVQNTGKDFYYSIIFFVNSTNFVPNKLKIQ